MLMLWIAGIILASLSFAVGALYLIDMVKEWKGDTISIHVYKAMMALGCLSTALFVMGVLSVLGS